MKGLLYDDNDHVNTNLNITSLIIDEQTCRQEELPITFLTRSLIYERRNNDLLRIESRPWKLWGTQRGELRPVALDGLFRVSGGVVAPCGNCAVNEGLTLRTLRTSLRQRCIRASKNFSDSILALSGSRVGHFPLYVGPS